MATLFSALQVALGAFSLLFGAWWTLLSILAIPNARPPRQRAETGARVAVIVPAHNEERLVARTVRSLHDSPYEPRPEVIVVADNCTDATASVAEAAGARVLIRDNASLRGKSYALEFALEHLRATPPDVVVVVDADSTVSTDFFPALVQAALQGEGVAQAHYEAAPSETDLGRLRRLAFSLVHWSRPLGASRLGLPTTLKGNGMAFAWAIVRDGMPGSGVTEDAAATLDLAAQGRTVAFVPHSSVSGLMAEQYTEAATQDERWEGGRAALLPRALVLAVRLAAKGNLRPAAAAAEVASPPLTLAAAGAGVAAGMGLLGWGSRRLAWLALGSLVTYVALGLAAARASRDDLSALASAPRFVLHKLAAYARLARQRPGSWERTERG